MEKELQQIAARRTGVLAGHLLPKACELEQSILLNSAPCLQFHSPENNEGSSAFDPKALHFLLDGQQIPMIQEMFSLFASNELFWHQGARQSGQLFTFMDYNTSKEVQREITFQRLMFLRDRGYFRGWLTDDSLNNVLQKAAMHEAIGMFDQSMGVKLGVHIHLWGGAVKYLGTKRHHDKWLRKTEDYEVAGCFGLTELGHGSNVRGIETVVTYDPSTEEFVVNTPCETAQKYWIGGAALHANHTIVFGQLHINGKNEGVHAFIVPIRDANGLNCPGVKIADCGHKTCLNGIDNGRMWFNNVRVPRENLLNAVADVTADGRYVSAISDPDQRFAAFMAPLTGGRVTLAITSINQCKIGLSIALRYSLSRRAFAPGPGEEETLLLDYPIHQRRLLPLLAKTFAMNFATNAMRKMYFNRQPADAKPIHVQTSGYKAIMSWHMLRTLQECREACGGMGVRSDNRIGHLRAEHDVVATFEGDNVVLMQSVSKALLGDYYAAKKKGKPLSGLGLEHLNGPRPSMSSATNSALLRDPRFQAALFRLRERDLLERMAVQVQSRVMTGMSLNDAFNESYQLGSDLGKAHAELDILLACQSAVEALPNGDLKEILGVLSSLFALSAIDEESAFLRYNLITPPQAQAIQEEIVKLCKQIRPHTLGLVNGFGLPGHLLGPIAFDWVDYDSWRHVEGRNNQVEAASWQSQGLHI